MLDRFWPSNLFLGGIPGAWYDPTDLATMFQDSTGTTPVTAVEQPVGLILDKSQGLAIGAELVTNGTFPVNLNGWTIGDGTPTWVAPGAMRLDSTSARQSAYQDVPTVIGATYEIRATLSNFSAGGFAPRLSVWSGAFVSLLGSIGLSAGTFVGRFRATATTIRLQAYADLGGIANFDDISVRELAGNHASQSTAASRPTYRARYNLLTQSEDFSQAVWTKTSSTVSANTSVAPDGTTTADTLAEAAAVSFHGANHQSVSVPVGTTLTLSASFKKGTSRYAQLNFGGSGAVSRWVSCVIDLDTGSITQSSAGAQATLVSAVSSAQGNGWYRVSLTGSVQTDTSIFSYVNMVSTGTPTLGSYGVETYLGVITNNILIWGAQLLTAADVTATGNAYQRIAAATVYDTAPIFRPYLAFDGLDDGLATASFAPGTDKCQAFSGIANIAGTNFAIVAEMSANAGSNNGAMLLYSPDNVLANYYGFLSRGTLTSAVATNAAAYKPPAINVVTGIGDISGDVATLRVNATQVVTSATDQGSGNYLSYPLYIGRRGGVSSPFNGRIYSLILRFGGTLSASQIAETELWVNARTGAY